jgi:MFS family permease
MNVKKYDPIVPVNIGLTQGLSSAFFVIVATRLGANPFTIGIVSSSPYLGNLFAPFWSNITQRIEIRKVIASAVFLSSIILFFLLFIKSPISFMLSVIIYFIFFGGWEVLYPALIDLIYSEIAISILSRFDEIRSVSYTLVVAFSGLIMMLWGHKITFFAGAVFLLISALIILNSKTDKVFDDSLEKTNSIKILKEDPGIRKLVLIFMIAGTGMLIMLPAIPILEVNLLKLSDAKIGILLAVNSLAYILGMEIWSRYVKSISRLYITFTIGLIAIIGMALIYTLLPKYFMLVIANVFCGIGGSSISFFWQTFSISNPDYRTEDLSSLHLFTCGIRGIYAPILGALIIYLFSVKVNFIFSLILVIAGLAVFLLKGKDIFAV